MTPILKETCGKDEAAQNMKKLIASLNTFTDDMRFCRGMALIGGKPAADVSYCIDKVGDKYLKPFRPLLAKVSDTVAGMDANHAANMIEASAQCYRYGNMQAAITLLEEGIISFFCERHGLQIDDKAKREIVNHAFTKKQLGLMGKLDKYEPLSEDKEQVVTEVEQDPLLTDYIIKAFANLCDIRNDVNHAGMRNHKQPLKVKNIESNLQKTLDAFMSLAEEGTATEQKKALPPLFINLSNHPSSSWTAEQLAAAEEFGELIDMPFPQVAPDATADDIKTLAEAQVAAIMKQAETHTVTVHVMGEMSLIYRIVRMLSERGIRCVCSTSYRVVKDQGDGRRLVEFNFTSFRDYE